MQVGRAKLHQNLPVLRC